jgi:anti-anti-sigma regulatory factor
MNIGDIFQKVKLQHQLEKSKEISIMFNSGYANNIQDQEIIARIEKELEESRNKLFERSASESARITKHINNLLDSDQLTDTQVASLGVLFQVRNMVESNNSKPAVYGVLGAGATLGGLRAYQQDRQYKG